MPDIFISYQRQERDAVTIVAEKLRALKFDIWFDEALRAGGSFDQEIADSLKAAKVVLVCWTPAAIASEWVRAEAAMAHGEGKLVACFLEPTDLVPPFNLIHAENLMAWAGQEDDDGWLGLIARIGEMTGRPGVATYHRAIRPEANIAELRGWAQANGADPLAELVWQRVALIEGESAEQRIAREKAEARTRDLKRAEAAARSKALAKARGLRDPKEQNRRMLRMTAALVVIGLLAGAGVGYTIYSGDRLRELDKLAKAEDVRAFMSHNPWGPVHAESVKKFAEIDAADWAKAQADGSVAAYQTYVDEFSKPPEGHFIRAAIDAKAAAELVAQAQEPLARLRLYDGEVNGKLDESTITAVTTFLYRMGAVVTGKPDKALIAQLDQAVAKRIAVSPAAFPRGRIGLPTENEFRRIAARMRVDGPTLVAIYRLESGIVGGFAESGLPTNRFHPHIFSQLTNGKYDAVAPNISHPSLKMAALPKTAQQSWAMLTQAHALDPEAAYKATAFGSYLIMGRSHEMMGFKTASEYAQFVAESEANQLEAFVRFVDGSGLLPVLQQKDWEAFARGYNGSGRVEQYAQRLRAEYERAQAEFGDLRPVVAKAPVPAEPPMPLEDEVVIGDTGLPADRTLLWLAVAGGAAASLAGLALYRRRA